MRPRHAVLAALLVVLAGCGGGGTATTGPRSSVDAPASTPADSPTSGQTTQIRTPTPTTDSCTVLESSSRETPSRIDYSPDADPNITVTGGDLALDPKRVFGRIETLTGTSVRPPDEIVLSRLGRYGVPRSLFERVLGLQSPSFTAGGFAVPTGTVYLNVGMNRTEREKTLAHEFHHIVFFQLNRTLYGDLGNMTSQQSALATAIGEGAAVYVEQAYWRRYMDRRGHSPVAELRRDYRTASPSNRTLFAPYYFGPRYIASRIDSPRHLEEIYENPPRTTEQLIHRLPPGSEPPAPLDVIVVERCEWAPNGTDTRGELFVRHVLQIGVSDAKAASAAAGWGNDVVRRFDNGSATGFVWTLRFDDASNASEFESVVKQYLDARGSRDGEYWTTDGATFRVVRATDESVVLVFGPRSFVNSVSIDGEPGEIEIRTS